MTALLASELSVEDASRVGQKVNLRGVHFSGLQARTVAAADIGADLGWTLVPIDLSWAMVEDGRELRVIVPVSLKVLSEAKAIAEISVMLRLDYDVGEAGESEHAVCSFVGISGCLHAWPYIRAEIQHLTTKIGLPPLVLPSVLSGHVAQIVGSVKRLPTSLPAAKAAPRRRLKKIQKGAKPRKT